MNLTCIGVSHQTASVEARERFAIDPLQTSAALQQALGLPTVCEAVALSTCNRVEWYVVSESGKFDALSVLKVRSPVEANDLEHIYQHDFEDTVRHLFRVASGLESMIVGETEILGQVKKAYATAVDAQATSIWLNKLFQKAFSVAKQVRSQTAITRGSVSVGSVAVDLAEKIFGNLGGCQVMVLGAGDTSERTAKALASKGVKSVIVSNRSHDRAVALAGEIGGRALHFDEWEKEFATLDILISSTAAPHFVVTRMQLDALMRTRPERPLFLIDIAVPRDIEPSVNDIDGVYLYDIDSLEAIARESLEIRRQEMVACQRIIEHHVAEFVAWARQRGMFLPASDAPSAPVETVKTA
ncbi:MAG: glutamyl-tRNA reductase [Chthoniobacterales bacterium]